MVAYSFKKQFIDPIRVGLGIDKFLEAIGEVLPKRHTIRANGKRRHARPGERVQLYHAMRSKKCMKIGEGICTAADKIKLHFYRSNEKGRLVNDFVLTKRVGCLRTVKKLDEFARSDGFENWNALREFWRVEHDNATDFEGTIIYWEPV